VIASWPSHLVLSGWRSLGRSILLAASRNKTLYAKLSRTYPVQLPNAPQPGLFFGVNGKPAATDVLRGRLHGRIAFANADLACASDHPNSIC